MTTFRRLAGLLSMIGLATGGMTVASPAEAAHLGCGSVVTTSTTLDSDIGPCPGDGLVVRASNITLDLGGRRVFGANGGGDNAGIRLAQVSGVTVTNGTVEGFDAGIVMVGGSGNVVTRTIVQNNVNDMQAPPCDLGDGIIMDSSDNNRIEYNMVRNNGPYGGITALRDADGNLISHNQVTGHNVVGRSGSGCGNVRQDEGIRIEGPGANDNQVVRNMVDRSLLAGIGLHGYVCRGSGAEPANSHTSILENVVRSTSGTSIAAGINILEQGPIGEITCASSDNTIVGNISTLNQADGIFVATTSMRNTINRNRVDQNGSDGIYLAGPTAFNTFTNIGPSLLDLVQPDRPPYVEGTDYRVMPGSGSGDVTAQLVPVDIALPPNPLPTNTNPVDTSTSGCEMSDFAGFPAGAVALLQRGTCTFVQKVNNAVAAGASAVLMFNEGQPGRTTANFGSVRPVPIPVLSLSYATGVQLYQLTQAGQVIVHVVTNTSNVLTPVPGAENNVLIENRGSGNGEHDGHDDNPNCDRNNWTGNVFDTVNQACVAANGGSGVVTATRVAAGGRDEGVADIGRNGAAATQT